MSHLLLQRTLKFTVDDLRANREGKLSEAQQLKYKAPEVNKIVLYAIFGHLALIIGILGSIAIASGSSALWFVLIIVFFLGLLPFAMMRNEGNIRPALRNDVARGKVEQVCGFAFLKEKKRREVYFELTVDTVTVKITRSQATAFTDGQSYCIYYLPDSRTLLSAEPTR